MKLYLNNITEPIEINKQEFVNFLNELLNNFDSLNLVSLQIETKDMALIKKCNNEQIAIDENNPLYEKLMDALSKTDMKPHI